MTQSTSTRGGAWMLLDIAIGVCAFLVVAMFGWILLNDALTAFFAALIAGGGSVAGRRALG